jgi:hypothetical protein
VRKFLYVFGAISLVVVVAVAVMIGWAAYRGSSLDTESKAFVDSAVPAIAAQWNKQELLDRASPQLLQAAKPGQMESLFKTLAQFGPLVQYEGAKGDSVMGYTTGTGSSVTANYVATARCRNGTAHFKLKLLKVGDRWTILDFYVDTPPEKQI